ncbi:MAG: MlaE family ABC transporter permease [Acidimicrobiales bacterium]
MPDGDSEPADVQTLPAVPARRRRLAPFAGSDGDGALPALAQRDLAEFFPVRKLRFVLYETGGTFAVLLEGLRRTWDVRKWWREYVDQCVFIARVTAIPVMMVAIPLGAMVALQVGQLTRQLGGESLTGAAVIVGIVREIAPLAAAILIAGGAGSAMTADMGARNIRDELAAMEVMSVNPVHRLVTPRLWASATIGVMLVSLIIVAGVGGGFFFNVVLQDVSPGAYFQSASALLQLSDLLTSLFKSFLFGFIAGAIACRRGMTCTRSPVGVGMAVKQAVVITLLVVFAVNLIITNLYFLLVPQRL